MTTISKFEPDLKNQLTIESIIEGINNIIAKSRWIKYESKFFRIFIKHNNKILCDPVNLFSMDWIQPKGSCSKEIIELEVILKL